MGAFQCAFGEQDAVIGEDADGIAPDPGKPADQGLAIEPLELVELAAVDDPGDDLAHIVGPAGVRRNDPVDFLGRVKRVARRLDLDRNTLRLVEVGNDTPGDAERVAIVERIMIGHTGDAAVHLGTAELLGGDDLAGRGADERRTAEKDRALSAHDDAFVRHRRNVRAARGARPHHQRDLRDAGRRQARLIVEDASEMLAVGKDLVLGGQKGAARIDEINAGQPVLAGDLLRPQVLLDGHREIGAAFDRRVVGDDDAFAAHDPADAGDDPGSRHLAVIHAIGGELRQLEKGRTRIEQRPHPFARQQLAASEMPAPGCGPAALADRRDLVPQILDKRPHRRRVRRESIGARVERCGKDRHARDETL